MVAAILMLALIGAVMAAGTASCAPAHVQDKRDTMVFGRVPLWIVGIVGYAVIAVATLHPTAMKVVAVGITLTTAWLVVKAIKVRMGCPLCFMVWGVNTVIVVLAFLR